MLSIDTNILLHALNRDAPEHAVARRFVAECGKRDDVAICELVLVELYVLLRNPAVVSSPLGAAEAAEICVGLRANPRWALIECAPVMADLWGKVAANGFARHRIFDLRLALTLRHHGVTEWVTRNIKDFEGLGFQRLIDPLAHDEAASRQ